MRACVWVDSHKGQFTVSWRVDEGPLRRFERFWTNELGYQGFEGQLKRLLERGYEVRVAVESTGNTRYFKRRVEALGVPLVVINTMKFKVVTESVKKTDRRDAATIAEFFRSGGSRELRNQRRCEVRRGRESRRPWFTPAVFSSSIRLLRGRSECAS